jgi:hypothetical protein
LVNQPSLYICVGQYTIVMVEVTTQEYDYNISYIVCRTSKSARRPLTIFLLFVFCLVRWSRHLVLWSLGTYGLREFE